MNCTEAKEALSALLDDALGSDEARAAEAHAASCAACRAWRAELSEVRQLLRGIDDADEPPGLAAEVGREVMAAIHGRVVGAKPAAAAPQERSARRMAWIAAGVSGLALASAATWAAWEESKRGEKRPEAPAAAPSTNGKASVPEKPDTTSVRPPPVIPDPPPVKPPRPGPTLHGHLEMRAGDEATRTELRELFRKWPGTFKASEPDADGSISLVVDFEGPADEKADEFEGWLREFQREHGAELRYWNYSAETR